MQLLQQLVPEVVECMMFDAYFLGDAMPHMAFYSPDWSGSLDKHMHARKH